MAECPTCEDTFDTKRGVKQHHAIAHNESLSKLTLECDWCGQEYKKYPSQIEKSEQNFCSQDCYGSWIEEEQDPDQAPRWGGGKVEVECAWCGDTTEKKKYRVEQREHNFCNHSCMGRWFSENQSGSSHHQYRSIEVECDNCGNKITRQPYEVEKHDHLYCSSECKAKHFSGETSPLWTGNNREVEVQCSTCSNTITRRKYVLEKRKNVFCSSDCHGQWLSENWVGQDNPRWEEDFTSEYGDNWYVRRKKTLERDNYECQDCGLTRDEHYEQYGYDLEVHHITPLRTFEDTKKANKLTNLVTLCTSCHRKRETS